MEKATSNQHMNTAFTPLPAFALILKSLDYISIILYLLHSRLSELLKTNEFHDFYSLINEIITQMKTQRYYEKNLGNGTKMAMNQRKYGGSCANIVSLEREKQKQNEIDLLPYVEALWRNFLSFFFSFKNFSVPVKIECNESIMKIQENHTVLL